LATLTLSFFALLISAISSNRVWSFVTATIPPASQAQKPFTLLQISLLLGINLQINLSLSVNFGLRFVTADASSRAARRDR
jgi:hypothetical protein